MDINTKQCKKCKEIKDLTCFSVDKFNRDGLRSKCKKCRSLDSKEWHKNNKEKVKINSAQWYKNNPEKALERSLKQRYNISLETFKKLLSNQNNVCAICQQSETAIDTRLGKPRMLAVDHCHTTGKVRGLLCTGCNAALGFIKENAERALKLANYIKQHGEK